MFIVMSAPVHAVLLRFREQTCLSMPVLILHCFAPDRRRNVSSFSSYVGQSSLFCFKCGHAAV